MTLSYGVLVVVTLAGLVLLVARRKAFRKWRHQPIIIRGNHVLVLLGVIIVASVYPMTISLIGRHKLNQERDARLKETVTAIERDAVTLAEVRDTARRQARLESPTNAELAKRSQAALVACGRTMRCRAQFTRVVNRVLRIRDGTIVPAPSTGGKGTRAQPSPSPAPTPRPPAPTVITPPARDDPRVSQLAADVADLRDQVKALKAGKGVDSGAVDGLDNRLADVERGLANILTRLPAIDRLVALLCKALPVCR